MGNIIINIFSIHHNNIKKKFISCNVLDNKIIIGVWNNSNKLDNLGLSEPHKNFCLTKNFIRGRQGIWIGDTNIIYKLTFGLTNSIDIVILNFENNIKLKIYNDVNNIFYLILTYNNIEYFKKLNYDILDNIKKINNDSPDLDLIYLLVKKKLKH